MSMYSQIISEAEEAFIRSLQKHKKPDAYTNVYDFWKDSEDRVEYLSPINREELFAIPEDYMGHLHMQVNITPEMSDVLTQELLNQAIDELAGRVYKPMATNYYQFTGSLPNNGSYTNGGYANATTTCTPSNATYVTIDPLTGKVVVKEYESKCGEINKSNTLYRDEKTMDIIKFAKGLTLTKEAKALRDAGLKDSEGNWTGMARDLALELLAEAKGFKTWREMSALVGGGAGLSTLEWIEIFNVYNDKLVEVAIAKLTDDKEKCCE